MGWDGSDADDHMIRCSDVEEHRVGRSGLRAVGWDDLMLTIALMACSDRLALMLTIALMARSDCLALMITVVLIVWLCLAL
eukprot:360113-Chlamydomonas_euryale.AAC.6